MVTEFKKRIRDQQAYTGFTDRVREELGDILWYVSNVSTKLGLKVSDVAQANLDKPEDRFGVPATEYTLFDQRMPPLEQLPRHGRITFDSSTPKVTMFLDGDPFGASLTDNQYIDDGYRYHDIFHLAYMAILGWSPV